MKKFVPTQKVFLMRNNKFLVLKRAPNQPVGPNKWDLPGGRLQFGEALVDSLRREVKEEIQSDIEIIKQLGTNTVVYNSEKQLIIIAWSAKLLSEKISISKEHTEYRWVSLREAKKLDLYVAVKSVLKFLK